MATPAATPVTTPEALTVATLAAPLLHTPPLTVLLTLAEVPAQIAVPPLTTPASGKDPAATVMPATEEPQLLVTV